jgi:hypothetical protein
MAFVLTVIASGANGAAGAVTVKGAMAAAENKKTPSRGERVSGNLADAEMACQ